MGQWGGPYCEVDSLPIVLLHRNSTTGEFKIVKRLRSNETDLNGGQFRFLQVEDIRDSSDSSLRSSFTPGLRLAEDEFTFADDLSQNSSSEEETISPTEVGPFDDDEVAQNDKEEYFYARECTCFIGLYPTSYCPFTVEVCQQPANWSTATHPGCLTEPPKRGQTKLLFLIVIAWYWCLLAFLLFTKYGHSFFDYLIRFFVPGWNNYVVNRIIQNDPHRAQLLLRDYVLRQRQRMEGVTNRDAQNEQGNQQENGQAPAQVANNIQEQQGEIRKPTSLALRTTIYKTDGDRQTKDASEVSGDHSTSSNEDEEDDCCIICFAPFVDGDRVGRLPCSHVFHVECLKIWLQRKNKCPLCQTKEIATPRYDDEELLANQSGISSNFGSSSIPDEEAHSTPLEESNALASIDEETDTPP
jgi:hypothetical protein